MTQQLLQQLVEMRGIETQYVDAWGKPATIAESSKAKLLNTLGYDTSSDEKIQSQITQDIKSVWLSPLNPVQVVRNTQEINLAVRLPIELVNDDHTLTVTCENGDAQTHRHQRLRLHRDNQGANLKAVLLRIHETLHRRYAPSSSFLGRLE